MAIHAQDLEAFKFSVVSILGKGYGLIKVCHFGERSGIMRIIMNGIPQTGGAIDSCLKRS